MDIKDHTKSQNIKHLIDFGAIDDAEYDFLCARAFAYQGLASRWNHEYDEVSNKHGKRLYKRKRIAAIFEFPSEQFIDLWLKEIENSFPDGVLEFSKETWEFRSIFQRPFWKNLLRV